MTKVRRITRIALSTVLLFLSAQIALPATPPFTLQTLVLFVVSSIMLTKDAVFTTLVYLALGTVGVPVFSGFQSGIGVILGIGGGFLISFPLIAFISSFFVKKFKKTFIPRFTVFAAATLLSSFIAYLWLIIGKFTDKSAGSVLLSYILPFLFFDLVKCAVAPYIVKKLEGILRK